MSNAASFLIIAGMSAAFFAGGVPLKEFSASKNVLHPVMSFCAFGYCVLLMVISQAGLARAMVVSSCAQIALSCAVAVIYYREPLSTTQAFGVMRSVAAAV